MFALLLIDKLSKDKYPQFNLVSTYCHRLHKNLQLLNFLLSKKRDSVVFKTINLYKKEEFVQMASIP